MLPKGKAVYSNTPQPMLPKGKTVCLSLPRLLRPSLASDSAIVRPVANPPSETRALSPSARFIACASCAGIKKHMLHKNASRRRRLYRTKMPPSSAYWTVKVARITPRAAILVDGEERQV